MENEEETSRSGRQEVTCDSIIRHPNLVYQHGDLYVDPSMSAEAILYAYQRFKSDGLLAFLFHENPKSIPPSADWFIDQYRKMTVLACYQQGPNEDKARMLGLGWINGAHCYGRFAKAELGEGFFRDTPPDVTLGLARLMLSWVFEVPQFQTLHGPTRLTAVYGTTPVPNRAAVAFFKKLGFVSSTEIPSYTIYDEQLTSVVISAMTRDRWRETFGIVEPADTESKCAA